MPKGQKTLAERETWIWTMLDLLLFFDILMFSLYQNNIDILFSLFYDFVLAN